MIRIKTDPIRNRLTIYPRYLGKGGMQGYIRQIERECKRLVPGFNCLMVFNGGNEPKGFVEDLLFITQDLISTYGGSRIACIRKNGKFPDGIDIPATEGLVSFQETNPLEVLN